jgi:hypothetical protein
MRFTPLLLAFIFGWFACEALHRLTPDPRARTPKPNPGPVEYTVPAAVDMGMVIVGPSARDGDIVAARPAALMPQDPRFASQSAAMGSGSARSGMPGVASGLPLKSRQALVHGLLILSLDRGEAGSASKMSAIALDMPANARSEVKFNQTVGTMMRQALSQACYYLEIRNKGWPSGHLIELSFEDKYSDKDGPSAAVACGLLVNSLITGKVNDSNFAVTGDMNADGSVQPIGGVAAKIRGATNGKCKLVAIPSKNEESLGDVLLTDGPAPFAQIQIYSIATFDDAEALALQDKPAPVQQAVKEMAAVQDLLLRNPSQIGSWLRNQHVLAKLQAVQKLAPNNLSAKYLLMYAAGKVPHALSLAGSLDAVEYAAADLVSSIKANRGQNANALRKDVVGSSITKLQALRAKCDPRLRAYAESIIRFGTVVKEAQDRPANSSARASTLRSMINDAADSADAEFNRLINDPKVREELKL